MNKATAATINDAKTHLNVNLTTYRRNHMKPCSKAKFSIPKHTLQTEPKHRFVKKSMDHHTDQSVHHATECNKTPSTTLQPVPRVAPKAIDRNNEMIHLTQ